MSSAHDRLIKTAMLFTLLGIILGVGGSVVEFRPIMQQSKNDLAQQISEKSDLQTSYDDLTVQYRDLVTKWDDQQVAIGHGEYEAQSNIIIYGSVCKDGWHSPSVGSGTCSWHGGVLY